MNEARLERFALNLPYLYSLNYQDLPEYFKVNTSLWMEEIGHYSTFTGIGSDQDESSNGMDKLQSAILAILDLYTDRDEESFQETGWGTAPPRYAHGRFDPVVVFSH
jgi:Cse1